MKRHDVASGVRSIVANRGLLRSLTVREIEGRYRGTLLGTLWAVVYPLVMLAVYTFLFGVIFKARWPGLGELNDFVLMLYCGLIAHGVLSETVTRSSSAVVSQPGYVKKVVFPLELLPLSHLGVALFNAAIGFGLLVIFLLAQTRALSPTGLLTPVIIAPLLLMVAGFAWFLAAIGVFFRDIGQIINLVMTMMLSFSPVFYPVSSAPPAFQKVMYLNPLTYPIEELRTVLVLGGWPDWSMWAAYSAVSLTTAVAGLWVFQRTRSAFADVV